MGQGRNEDILMVIWFTIH